MSKDMEPDFDQQTEAEEERQMMPKLLRTKAPRMNAPKAMAPHVKAPSISMHLRRGKR